MLARHRGLIRAFTARDILARYRGSVGGLAWSVVQPLALLALYTLVFSWILEIRLGPDVGTDSFALFLLAGLLPWQAIQEGLTRSAGVLLEHSMLVKRTPFPTDILPVYVSFSALTFQLIGTAVLLVAMLPRRPPTPALLAFPVLLALQVLLTVGLGWMIASVNVYVRDVGQLLGIALTLWMFLTPIVYPPSLVPAGLRFLLGVNPLALLVEGYRRILLQGSWPSPVSLTILAAMALAAFSGGFALFRRLQPGFADVL